MCLFNLENLSAPGSFRNSATFPKDLRHHHHLLFTKACCEVLVVIYRKILVNIWHTPCLEVPYRLRDSCLESLRAYYG